MDLRWKSPWPGAEDAYKVTMGQSRDQLYKGFQETIQRYFPNAWKPEYEKFVRILYAPTLSADWPRLAMVRAIYRQMPYLDPVVYDWAHIQARTLVIGGDKDGENFPALAKHVADTIPHGELVLIPNVGHVPHIQAPDVFLRELLKFLA
jgi:pimeloyl-ACP methyl ester carboxylesterase